MRLWQSSRVAPAPVGGHGHLAMMRHFSWRLIYLDLNLHLLSEAESPRLGYRYCYPPEQHRLHPPTVTLKVVCRKASGEHPPPPVDVPRRSRVHYPFPFDLHSRDGQCGPGDSGWAWERSTTCHGASSSVAVVDYAYPNPYSAFSGQATDVASITLLAAEVLHSMPEEVSMLLLSHSTTLSITILLRTPRVMGRVGGLDMAGRVEHGKGALPDHEVLPFLRHRFRASVPEHNSKFANGGPTSNVRNLRQSLTLNLYFQLCEKTFIAGSVLSLTGCVLAEGMSQGDIDARSPTLPMDWRPACRPISGESAFGSLARGLNGSAYIFLAKFIYSLEYGPSPAPTILGCLPIKGNANHLSVLYILIVASELSILAITVLILLLKYKRSRSRLVTIFYRDGLIYFLIITALSVGNIICNFVAPQGYSYLLAHPQLVLHSIMSTRMVLHMRKVNESPGTDIPLTDMKFAERVNAQVETSTDGVGASTMTTTQTWPERRDSDAKKKGAAS
ncbi:hypothetical protein NMY22_g7520 [Coprinellus aureogranulatus]|nr:hypothetical protein NMY22_g7520 [Coprinellus aureogranulatus]